MFIQTIIIGGGPAGLQMGYFLETGGYPYMILEREATAASFFDKYPHSGKLISINKKYTGSSDPEFNLRHDWNSLLTHKPMRFTTYSDEYYPDSSDLHRYLNDYAQEHKLKIQFNTTVTKVEKEANGQYTLTVTHNRKVEKITCEKLICATGLGVPVVPDVGPGVKRPIKHYSQYEKDYFKKPQNLEQFKNKSVLILGNGNSAFELANLLNPICSTVIVQGRKSREWALSSHYVGDIRGTYLPFYDTFLLKSLNAIDFEPLAPIQFTQETESSPYKLSGKCRHCPLEHDYSIGSMSQFDNVIFCTGWKADLSYFAFDVPKTKNEKYPQITPTYESVAHKNLFFLGSLMHSLDFRKGSGGFIHGFRYLIKYFFNMHYDKKFSIQRFKSSATDTLIKHILTKINTSSALYQMYGQLGDIFIYDPSKGDITYFNHVPPPFLDSIPRKPNPNQIIFLLMLVYGEPVTEIGNLGRKKSGIGSEEQARLLHPVIRVIRESPEKGGEKELIDDFHLDEDLIANFTKKEIYYDRLVRFFAGFFKA
jgi:thioredoxin reductase